MNRKIRVLILEDQPTDAELMLRELRLVGYEPEWTRVMTELDFLTQLELGWEIILADYSMPQFTGLQALELLKQRGLDIPFIIISGAIGEEVAVATMKAGASDYLMKGNLARLGQAIKRELGDAAVRRERTRLEADMLASEVRYRRLFEAAKDGILILNAETGSVVDVNPFLLELLGYPRDAFVGKHLWELGSFKDIVANQDNFAELQANDYIRYEDLPLETADGRRIQVEFISNVYLVNSYRVIQCNIRDITERKLAEEELLNLRKAVEQTVNAVVITDLLGNIEYVNPAFEKTTGHTKAEALGQNPRLLKSGEQNEAFYQDLWASIQSGKTWRGEFHNKRKDGTLYWESATISPIFNNKGEILHFIAIKEDITKKKAMEAKLKDALIHAEAGNLAKSEFLSIMSHELRTPLNGVLGFAELLTLTPLAQEQESLVETISECGKHLLGIVTDILDFSSIEAGNLSIEVAPMAVAEVVELSALAIQKSAAEKAVEFRCETSPDVPQQITGDALRIRQILINLLGNAIKFTSSGSVVLRVAPSPESRFLDFSVEDTGIGMSSETIGLLFKPFTQADSKMSRAFEGTGLGLAISKRLAEAMGGSITVASIPDKGSTFTFHFPLEPASVCTAGLVTEPPPVSERESCESAQTESRPSIQTGGTPAEGKLVLVVEDDPTNSFLAKKMLQSLGYRAEFAVNGVEAVQAFVPGKYDAILMDVVMTKLNGLEATKKIRETEAGSRVPIIALTANVTSADRELCLAAGMNDFLAKPFKMEALANALASVTQIS